MYKLYFKHIIDFFVAFLALLFFSPLFIIIMIGLYFANKGNPFFFQKRPGKDERIFEIIKFKTMNEERDTDGVLLPDAERLTFMGKFVRKTSLDEIPQLINVLQGNMSIIGPRPLLPEYLSVYDETQKKRHNVRPGITGLAQVKGRNQMLFSERLKNDVYYVENVSLLLDIKIVFMTVRSIFFDSKSIVLGQTVDEVDDVGLSKNLSANHFKKKTHEF